MVTVVKTYDIKENPYYKKLIDAVMADDDYVEPQVFEWDIEIHK